MMPSQKKNDPVSKKRTPGPQKKRGTAGALPARQKVDAGCGQLEPAPERQLVFFQSRIARAPAGSGELQLELARRGILRNYAKSLGKWTHKVPNSTLGNLGNWNRHGIIHHTPTCP